MSAVADSARSVSSLVIAALLLCAREFLARLKLPHPTVAQIIAATGATRSRAYELKNALLAQLPTLQRPVGRPSAPPLEPVSDATAVLSQAVLRYMVDHPGCAYGGAVRRRYSDAFRAFVLELREQHSELAVELFASAVLIPIGTLKDWLAIGNMSADSNAELQDDGEDDEGHEHDDKPNAGPTCAQIETVLSARRPVALRDLRRRATPLRGRARRSLQRHAPRTARWLAGRQLPPAAARGGARDRAG